MTDEKDRDAETAATDETEAEDTATATEDAAATEETEQEEPIFVEDPQFDLDYKGDCAYEVKVTIPPANRRKQSDEIFEELSHDAEVPGFRRGKVPRKLLERKFSKAVKGEVETKLVGAAFEKLIKDNDLRPISRPEIDGLEEDKQKSDEEPIEVTFKFEVAPRVELGKYRGVEVERPVVHVDDSDVEESIQEQLNRYAVYESVADGQAQEGDQVLIDFTGTIDGVEFPGGSAQGYPYILGTRRFFPEFEDALQGAATGETKEVDITFPDDYHAENLRGKTAHFAIKVNEIKRRKAPELTDDFAKQMGHDTVDAFRQAAREGMQRGADAQSERYAESRALDAVIAASTFQIPKSLVEATAEETLQDEVRQLLSMRVPMAEIRQREEHMREHARGHALRDIQAIVALNEIAEAEGVEVSDEDFEAELANLATRAGIESEAAARYIEESGRRSSYEARILRAKAMRIVMEHAQITDKEVTREEAEAASEEHDHDHDH